MVATLHELRRQIVLSPSSCAARLALAEHFAQALDWTQAAEQASLAVGCDVSSLAAHMLLVRAYLADKRGVKAAAALAEALVQFPLEISLHVQQADLAIAEARASAALLALDTAAQAGAELARVQPEGLNVGALARARCEVALRAASAAYALGLPVLAQRHLVVAESLAQDPELRQSAQLLRTEWGEPPLAARGAALADPERVLARAQMRLSAALATSQSRELLAPVYQALRARDLPNVKSHLVRALGAVGAGTAAAFVLAALRVDLCLAAGDDEDARRLLARPSLAVQLAAPGSAAAPTNSAALADPAEVAWREFRAECMGALAERIGDYAAARQVYAHAAQELPHAIALHEAHGDMCALCNDLRLAIAAWGRAAKLEPAGPAAVKLFAAQRGQWSRGGGAAASDSAAVVQTAGTARVFALATSGGGAGCMTLLEATAFSGVAAIEFTGQVGSVGQDAARAAHACLRAKARSLGIQAAAESSKLHIHFTDAYISKDGPSAGLALALVGLSALAGVALEPGLAVTGAITLGGVVEGVGGVADKLIAAYLAGSALVLVPRANLFDVRGLPTLVRRKLRIVPVASLEEAMVVAFAGRFSAAV